MPKTREQNQEIKDARKESILRVALYEFALKGYAAVRIDDITKKAKCSHGLFYHYFQTKEDLFHSLMNNIISELEKIKDKVDFNQKAKFALQDFINEIVGALKSNKNDLACIFYLVLNLHLQKGIIPKPTKPKPKDKKTSFEIIYELIERGQKENDFLLDIDPKEITIAILSMIKGLAFNRLNIGSKQFVCPSGRAIMNLVLKRNVIA